MHNVSRVWQALRDRHYYSPFTTKLRNLQNIRQLISSRAQAPHPVYDSRIFRILLYCLSQKAERGMGLAEQSLQRSYLQRWPVRPRLVPGGECHNPAIREWLLSSHITKANNELPFWPASLPRDLSSSPCILEILPLLLLGLCLMLLIPLP